MSPPEGTSEAPLPVVDIHHAQAAEQIRAACLDHGFFYGNKSLHLILAVVLGRRAVLTYVKPNTCNRVLGTGPYAPLLEVVSPVVSPLSSQLLYRADGLTARTHLTAFV